MTIETLVLDAILAKFDDTASPSVVYTTTTQVRGAVTSKIPGSALPHVQAFSPLLTSEIVDTIQKETNLEFAVVLTDVTGTADAMRLGLEALQRALRAEPTLGALVTDCSITSYFVGETDKTEQDSAGATLSATYRPAEVFSANEGDIDVMPWADNIADIDTFQQAGDVQAAFSIPGGFEVNKRITGNTATLADFGPFSTPGNFPIEDTIEVVKETRFLRFAFYLTTDASPPPPFPFPVGSPAIVSADVELFVDISPTSRLRITTTDMRYGWNLLKIDLDDRGDGTTVTGPDPDFSTDTIVHIRIRWRTPDTSGSSLNLDDPFIIKCYRLFFREEDRR